MDGMTVLMRILDLGILEPLTTEVVQEVLLTYTRSMVPIYCRFKLL